MTSTQYPTSFTCNVAVAVLVIYALVSVTSGNGDMWPLSLSALLAGTHALCLHACVPHREKPETITVS